MKLFGKSALLFCASVAITLSANASVFTLGEMLLKPISIKSKIVKEGVSGASVTTLKDSIRTSVVSLKHGYPDLSTALADIKNRANREDQAKIGRVMAALKMSHKDVEGETFRDVVNDLAYIASVYGEQSAKVLNCSYCKADELATLGFSNNLVKVADSNLMRVVQRVPKTPAGVTRYISRLSRNNNIKDASRYLNSSERRSYAIFLSFSEQRAKKEYREFFNAVAKFSKGNSREVTMVGPRAKNSFWKIIDGKFSPERAAKLAKAIDEAANKPVSQREDAFFKELYKVSDKTPETLSSIEELKSKKCFFK
ncbi:MULTISPECIES: hypothetical protein [Halobacteriovorax]|uniref:Uncharacterized protein n=1 Tax=Halobacteriovorax vibrionivorans TaxID=2152716 RepID=A0ABY0ICP8_9BACT|nr:MULTISPECIES: hypothetical protein [Halobacteriovorax]AYF44640.1 hypothetical protein BALOs_1640 [Halobacteriovorax sp. BALOs_7]RZF20726.1 hypothetical protein DAY19_12125 [Halobacteriovorax vibrionivorans]TGD48865.1 hypothetical protein EP118_01605 [Halobacteriovorax sp. Y22]